MRVTVIPIVFVVLEKKWKNWKSGKIETTVRIIKIGWNTQRSPGDLKRLAVTQNPVKDH